MFDVQDVSRFYRCPITDVHIGRSLLLGAKVEELLLPGAKKSTNFRSQSETLTEQKKGTNTFTFEIANSRLTKNDVEQK